METAGIRKEVHEEIDRMTDEEVRGLKEFMATYPDPVAALFRNAPFDDEPYTEEEQRLVAEADEWFAKNGGKGSLTRRFCENSVRSEPGSAGLIQVRSHEPFTVAFRRSSWPHQDRPGPDGSRDSLQASGEFGTWVSARPTCPLPRAAQGTMWRLPDPATRNSPAAPARVSRLALRREEEGSGTVTSPAALRPLGFGAVSSRASFPPVRLRRRSPPLSCAER